MVVGNKTCSGGGGGVGREGFISFRGLDGRPLKCVTCNGKGVDGRIEGFCVRILYVRYP